MHSYTEVINYYDNLPVIPQSLALLVLLPSSSPFDGDLINDGDGERERLFFSVPPA